jgi:hypothetical protein
MPASLHPRHNAIEPESLRHLPMASTWFRKPYAATELARTLRSILDR